MEVDLEFLVSVAVVFIFSTFFVFTMTRRRSKKSWWAGNYNDGQAVKLPPGSFGWPIIGETMEFLFGDKPEKFVGDRMKRYSPDIFKTKILGEKTAVLCGPKGHKFLFSNDQKIFTVFRPHPMQRLFRSYQPPAGAAAAAGVPTNDESKVIRQPGFLKPEALAKYLGKMDSISQQLLQSQWEGKEEDEVVKAWELAKMVTLTLSCRFFLGIDSPEIIARRLVNHFDDVTLGLHSIMLNFPGTTFYRAKKAAAAIRKELIPVIKEKRKAAAIAMAETAGAGARVVAMDILSHIILAATSNNYSTGKHPPDNIENVIADKIMGLIVAGYSTVATVITFLMKYVGERPDIYDKLRTEQMEIASSKKKPGEALEWEDIQKMKYSWNVVRETMRLNPPLQGTFREVLNDFTYAGYTVPKGWKVYWTVSTTNMNPEYYKEPEKFNPSRYEEEGGGGESKVLPPYTDIPFGGGPRMCPGKEYARLAILTFVHNLVKKYKWEVVFPNEKVNGGMMPNPEKGLPIRLRHL